MTRSVGKETGGRLSSVAQVQGSRRTEGASAPALPGQRREASGLRLPVMARSFGSAGGREQLRDHNRLSRAAYPRFKLWFWTGPGRAGSAVTTLVPACGCVWVCVRRTNTCGTAVRGCVCRRLADRVVRPPETPVRPPDVLPAPSAPSFVCLSSSNGH